MKKLFAASLTTLVACATVTNLFVQNASARTTVPVDQRETNQEQRIQQGVQSGRLTPQEARKLERREAKIRVLESRYKADGKLTHRENCKLQHKLDRASRDIAKAEHNRSHR